MKTLRWLFALSFLVAPGRAQHHAMPAPAGEKPVTLLPGMGTWKRPIATRSPEAQKFFDQGLALLYGFNRYEALRSFRKASELDPHAAMAFWGMAMALGPYVNMDLDPSYQLKESCDAVNAGLKIADTPARERVWLEAAATRCPDFADPSRYVAAMREIAHRNPDDPDAATLYAEALMVPVRWHWYLKSGAPAEGVAEAERVLEAVLRRHPLHPGANHLYIHAVESSPTPERAIPAAQRLMAIVPDAGHLVHMPGHIWLATGDYGQAAVVNERAAEVDRKYFATTGVSGTYAMYYMHNLSFILYARAMQGRVADTQKAIRDISAASKSMLGGMPEMAGVFETLMTQARVRIQRWDEILAAPVPQSPAASDLHWARGMALAAKNDLAAARKEQAEFEAGSKAAPRDIMAGNNKLGAIIDVAAAVLSARLEQDAAKSVALWRRAVELQDALVYDEPPGWFYPVRESLGAALLRAGDAAAAEEVFREGVRRSPNNGRMLFGLLESLKAQKKTDAANWVQKEFNAAWRGSELKLSLKDL